MAKEPEVPGPDKIIEAWAIAISWLFPGFLTFWGVRYALGPRFPDVPGMDTNAGFFLVLVASGALGLLLAGIRQILLDEFLWELGNKGVPFLEIVKTEYADQHRWDPGFEIAHRDVRAMFWPYYQFYGNSFAGAVLFYAAWVYARGFSWTPLAVFLAASFVLIFNARFALNRFLKRRENLVVQWERHHPQPTEGDPVRMPNGDRSHPPATPTPQGTGPGPTRSVPPPQPSRPSPPPAPKK